MMMMGIELFDNDKLSHNIMTRIELCYLVITCVI